MNSSIEANGVFVPLIDDIKSELNDSNVLNNLQDPLQENEVENTTNISPVQFPWEFTDEQLLCDPTANEPIVRERCGRAKRQRLTNLEKGVWSTTDARQNTGVAVECRSGILPAGKGPANRVANPLEAWLLLVDEPILGLIVRYTNEEIARHKNSKTPARERATDLTELRAWLGLNYLCGIFRNSPHNGPLAELWTIELGNAIFRTTMSLQRYTFLSNALRFGDTKKPAKSLLSGIQTIWDKFMVNFRSYYSPSGYCVVGEHRLATEEDAKVPAEESSPSMTTLSDAKTLYMSNALITESAEATSEELLQLVCDVKGTQRTICLRDFNAPTDLATTLQQHQLNVVGLMPTSSKEVPNELKHNKLSHKFFHEDQTLQTMYSGYLLTCGIPRNIDSKQLYDCCRNSFERLHVLAATYDTRCATPSQQQNRWQMAVFHQLLNYAALNAWILLRLSEKGDPHVTQRDFQRQLGLYLTQQQLKRNLQAKERLSLVQKLNVAEMLGESTDNLLATAVGQATAKLSEGVVPAAMAAVPEGVQLQSKLLTKRARCRSCPSREGTKTRYRCQQCLGKACLHHLIVRCADCTGVQVVD